MGTWVTGKEEQHVGERRSCAWGSESGFGCAREGRQGRQRAMCWVGADGVGAGWMSE